MSDPPTLMAELDDLAKRLDAASRELYIKEEAFGPVEEQFDEVWDELLIDLVDQYEEEGKRSSEDIRKARVRRLIRGQYPDLFKQHKELRDAINRIEKRAKRIERQVSSKQSQLSFLKTEVQAVG